MTGRLTIVNPIALPEGHTAAAVAFPLAPRPKSLEGRRVGLFWNGKNQGDVALARTEVSLAKLYEGCTFTHYLGDKGGLLRYASEPLKQQIVAECDVLVGTTADCGSCTSWLMREMAAFEERGLPTVSWVAVGFEEDARFSAEVFGCPDLPFAVAPLPFTNGDPVHIAQMVDDATARVIEGLTTSPTADRVRPIFDHLTLCADPQMTFEGEDLLECFDVMQERFVENGWSDGMPLIPPTRAKVDAMVAASGRAADDVIGVFAPGMGIGTVEKIAANAVMAGAKPNAMPVILAMAECVLDDTIGLRTFAMSTGPQAPIVMVSGPIADEIGMNHGVCALGPGSVSAVNVAIGRTLRLIMMNVGHSYPGISDMDTIGSSMKFSACVAENEDRNPWAPFRVAEGFAAEESTVTVNVPYGVCELFDFQNHDPELLVESYATVTRNVAGAPSPGGWLCKEPADPSAGYPFNGVYHNVIMMCPEHAEVFANAGWTIDDIQRTLHEKSQLPFRLAMINKPMPLFEASHPELRHLLDDPDADVSLYPSAKCFQVFVVGAVAGRSLYFHGGTGSVTKPVAAP